MRQPLGVADDCGAGECLGQVANAAGVVDMNMGHQEIVQRPHPDGGERPQERRAGGRRSDIDQDSGWAGIQPYTDEIIKTG
jgi:hypothetical protein